ncbi:hypothetical protein BOTBODRAFT_26818 [Botryobasidium botryosum FD-172 SS1]|uniref:3-hydroxyacyl-CoA dehydrogenase n=1 Tax=Botryobasidium botryosum (strain FD-172 SS1) TaxID=930990 RepID=A0A067MYJ0_BOTB1|nr:hypothetical protein BOTBODRAFT_26818 [Botryobasidium botryosum FD-172 SS1]
MLRLPATSAAAAFRSSTASATASARLLATARHLSSSDDSPRKSTTFKPVQNVTLFGAGLMGAGIAQVAAHNGFKVVLCDTTPQALKNGLAIIEKSLSRIARKSHPDSADSQAAFVSAVLDSIRTTTDPREAVNDADLVVEAIVENLEIKQRLFSVLDEAAHADCLFATNTSSLGVGEIASVTGESRRKRFGGLHFFNRTPQMKLVEIIRTNETSQDTLDALADVCTRMKKTAVSAKDTPGFIVNRLLVPYMMEAIRMVERGDATPKDIDTAMKLGAAMGPIELTDFVGLDTSMFIIDGWRKKIDSGEEKDLIPELVREVPLVQEKVAAGKLGRKTGEGFYKY